MLLIPRMLESIMPSVCGDILYRISTVLITRKKEKREFVLFVYA